VAAAFRAPVGGVLFALESLSTHWSEHLLLTCFFTTAIVHVTVLWLLSKCSGGGCGFFGGEANEIIYHMQNSQV
jgi:chloride channel 7